MPESALNRVTLIVSSSVEEIKSVEEDDDGREEYARATIASSKMKETPDEVVGGYTRRRGHIYRRGYRLSTRRAD